MAFVMIVGTAQSIGPYESKLSSDTSARSIGHPNQVFAKTRLAIRLRSSVRTYVDRFSAVRTMYDARYVRLPYWQCYVLDSEQSRRYENQ